MTEVASEPCKPPRLRRRGPCSLTTPKKKRPLIDDPFEKCCGCGTDLGGFLTFNASAKKMTVLLSCGHVVCPDCHYKMKKPHEAGRTGHLHRESQFSCTKCNAWVFPLYLPSLADLDLPRCSTPQCKSLTSVYFCNNCRVNICAICRRNHDSMYPSHNVILTPQGKKTGNGTNFSRKHVGCIRHNNTTTSRCTGCGDIVCGKCNNGYTDVIDTKHVRHERMDVSVSDVELESIMHDTNEFETKLLAIERNARKKRVEFQNQTDILKNEVCVHFYNIINAALGRCYQVLQRIQAEEVSVIEKFRSIETKTSNAIRRIAVGCELDERARNMDLLDDQVAADIYKSVAYTIFRPFYEEYTQAKRLTEATRHSPIQLELREISTTPVVDLISSWGGAVVSSCGDLAMGLCQQFAIPKFNTTQSWDNKTPVPSIVISPQSKHRVMNLQTSPRMPHPLFYFSIMRHIYMTCVDGNTPPAAFPMIHLRKADQPKTNAKPVEARSEEKSAKATITTTIVAQPPSSTPDHASAQAQKFKRPSEPSQQPQDQQHNVQAWMTKISALNIGWKQIHGFVPKQPGYPKLLPNPMLDLFRPDPHFTPEQEKNIQKMYISLRKLPTFSDRPQNYVMRLAQLMALNNVELPFNSMDNNAYKIHPQAPQPQAQQPLDLRRPSSKSPPTPTVVNVTPGTSAASQDGAPTTLVPLFDDKEKTVVPIDAPKQSTSAEEKTATAKVDPTRFPTRIILSLPKRSESKDSDGTPQNADKSGPSTPRIEVRNERLVMKIPRPPNVTIMRPVNNDTNNNGREANARPVASHKPPGFVSETTTSRDTRSPQSDASDREIDQDGSHRYCWVCNDTDGHAPEDVKGMCSSCPRVYHQTCHLPFVKDWQTMPDDWVCTLCERVGASNSDGYRIDPTTRMLCYKVLLSCYNHVQAAGYFAQPVPDDTPGYKDVISNPMDLGTIGKRLQAGAEDLITDTSDFVYLMNLVFQNCAKFNSKDSEVARAGRIVWKSYQTAIRRFLPQHIRDVWLYISLHASPSAQKKSAAMNAKSNTIVAKPATPKKRKHGGETGGPTPKKKTTMNDTHNASNSSNTTPHKKDRSRTSSETLNTIAALEAQHQPKEPKIETEESAAAHS